MNEKQWNQLQIGAALGYPRRGPISVEEQRMVVAELKRLKAIEAAAREVDASIAEWRTDRWGMEHLYLGMGDGLHGFDRETTNKLAMALWKLHDALTGAGEKGA